MAAFPQVGADFGRYRIERELGHGGMGVVYAATDRQLDRRVALKVVATDLGGTEEFLARFAREATLLARLDSPHVTAIYDYGEHEGSPYIATQLVPGGDLGELLRVRGPMPPQTAAGVCAQIADALADAHRAGVVHRDVKPSNVLLREPDALHPHAFLCDFGIARGENDGLTMDGSVTGTWRYLAPECGLGAPATARSDVYSLGCLLWATLTGRAPYPGSDVEVALAHQRAPIPQLSEHDDFGRLANTALQRSLAKDPAQRYADMEAFRVDLLALGRLRTAGVQPVPPPAPATPGGPGTPASPTPPSPATPSGPTRRSGPHSAGPAGPAGSPGSPGPTGVPGPGRPRSTKRRTALIAGLAVLGMVAVVGAGAAVALTRPWDHGNTPTPTPASEPSDPKPVTGDLDGDGFGDVQLTTEQGKTLHTVQALSDGEKLTAQPETTRPNGRAKDASVNDVGGDFDGDGVMDALVESRGPRKPNPKVTLVGSAAQGRYTGTLSGGAKLDVRLTTPGDRPATLTLAGDFDGDGMDDLALVDWQVEDTAWTVSIAASTGTGFGRPSKPVALPGTGQSTLLRVGDLDGDGTDDLVAQGLRGDTKILTPYLRRGDTFDRLSSRRFADYVTQLVTMDLNGDGRDEMVNIDETGDESALFVSRLRGTTLTKARPSGSITDFHKDSAQFSYAVSDVDGDGHDDLVRLGGAYDGRVVYAAAALSSGSGFTPPDNWGRWKQPVGSSYDFLALGMPTL